MNDRGRSATSEPRAGPGARPILVVDDDPAIRESIQWVLEDEGFVVATASDVREALDVASRIHPALVLLDMTLPVLSGEEVADALRANGGPPIIVITAAGRAAEKAQRCGAVAYLQKPFDISALAVLVRRHLQAS